MPTEGFEDRMASGTLSVALVNGAVDGYLLYDLPRELVKIVHLCVATSSRRQGVAAALISDLISRYRQRRGIVAHCRRDFAEASATWEALGFRPERDRRGRSRSGHLLTIWWLDFGHDDLFSMPAQPRALCALDQTVYEDLVTTRPEGVESRRLNDDWVAELVESCVTDEVHRESNRCSDVALRQRLLTSLGGWRHIARGVRPRSDVLERVGELAPQAGTGDHRHVTLALAGGASYFVTRDRGLLNGAGAIHDEFRIEILRPEWLIRELDRARRHDHYEPVALHATNFYELALTPSRTDEFVRALLNSADGERKAHLDAEIRESLAAPDTDTVKAVVDDKGRIVAGVAYRVSGEELLLRIARARGADKAARTIARQLLGQIRRLAASQRLSTIRLQDRDASLAILDSLQAEGFGHISGVWLCELEFGVVDATSDDIWSASRREVEHWPVKILNCGIPTFMLPIESVFAEQLFDTALASETLLGRETKLGLSREHVYYRSARTGRFVSGPGRILWYVKANKRRNWNGGVRAVSYLEEVVVDRPRTLFARHAHLGIWSQQQVLDVSHDGEVMALRFINSEPFDRVLPLDELRRLYQSGGVGLQLQGPSRVPEHVFRLIYEQCSSHARP
jgi:GNAT superfamily N-acetyltransferase